MRVWRSPLQVTRSSSCYHINNIEIVTTSNAIDCAMVLVSSFASLFDTNVLPFRLQLFELCDLSMYASPTALKTAQLNPQRTLNNQTPVSRDPNRTMDPQTPIYPTRRALIPRRSPPPTHPRQHQRHQQHTLHAHRFLLRRRRTRPQHRESSQRRPDTPGPDTDSIQAIRHRAESRRLDRSRESKRVSVLHTAGSQRGASAAGGD